MSEGPLCRGTSNILSNILIQSSTQWPQWKALKYAEQAINQPHIRSEVHQLIIPDFDQDNVKHNIELVFPSGKGHRNIKISDEVQIESSTQFRSWGRTSHLFKQCLESSMVVLTEWRNFYGTSCISMQFPRWIFTALVIVMLITL